MSTCIFSHRQSQFHKITVYLAEQPKNQYHENSANAGATTTTQQLTAATTTTVKLCTT